MEIKVQGRRRERPKRRWLDRVRDDIKEKGLSGGGGGGVYDHATWRHTSSNSHQSGNKIQKKKTADYATSAMPCRDRPTSLT